MRFSWSIKAEEEQEEQEQEQEDEEDEDEEGEEGERGESERGIQKRSIMYKVQPIHCYSKTFFELFFKKIIQSIKSVQMYNSISS